jgi:hypothetical protein
VACASPPPAPSPPAASRAEYDDPRLDELAAELPIGSSRAQAEAFLQSHHMEWSFSSHPANDPGLLGRYYGAMPDPDSRSSQSAATLRVEIDVDQESRVSALRFAHLAFAN